MKCIIGIDPGQTGGLAIVGDDMSASAIPMPTIATAYDVKAIHAWMIDQVLVADLIVIEKVGAMPKQGLSSTFKFGMGYGMLQGIAACMPQACVLVVPPVWKRLVLGSVYAHDKLGTIQFCRDKFPQVNLVLPRCRVPHDGMADALALAAYGQLILRSTND